MKTLFNISLVLVLFVGQQLFAYDINEQKFKKSYKVNANTHLKINNQFGEVKVIATNQQEIEVEVFVIVSMKNTSKAEEKADKIKILESVKGDVISLKTDLGTRSMNLGRNEKFEVNYVIHMPVKVKMDIDNSFGHIILPDYTGVLNINLEYGDLSADKLSGLQKLNLSFGKADISSVGDCEMKLSYASGVSIEKSGRIKMKEEFSKLKLGHIEAIDIKSSYGKLEIDEIDELSGKADFSGFQIGKLNKRLDMKVTYASGKFRIDDVSPDFELISIDSEFSQLELSLPGGLSAQLKTYHSFGSLKMDYKDYYFKKEVEKDFSKEYQGWVGKGENAKALIDISTSYGSLKIR